MAKIVVFNMITLDGYYAGVDGDISWHNITAGDEFSEFVNKQTGEFGTHIYGRVTYELMASYWPTEQRLHDDPVIAALMNKTPKKVYSTTLKEVLETELWQNITVLKEINVDEVKKWKVEEEKDMVIFGSGKIVQEFTNLGLIDEYRLMVNPLILGKGKLLFENLTDKRKLNLISTREFKSGNVLLCYEVVMPHFVCLGECEGVSDHAKSCDTPTCSMHKKPLIECCCADGRHQEIRDKELKK